VSRRTHTSKKEKAAKRAGEEVRGTADKQDSSAALQENRQQTTGQRFQESHITRKEIEAKPIEEAKTQISLVKDYQEQILDESKTLIPRYANVVKNYQEWALESTARIVEDYVEIQNSVINSVYESTIPYYENVNREYGNWSSEIWAISASNIAENISAAARISKDTLFGNIDVLKISFEQAKHYAEKLSRITVNSTNTIANTAVEFGNNRH
jgi:hypothetical protein